MCKATAYNIEDPTAMNTYMKVQGVTTVHLVVVAMMHNIYNVHTY